MKNNILLGFEIGTGEKVFINPAHLLVAGLTDKSGKTTTLQGIIKRGGFKAIVFKTKIGERGITEGTEIPPFFKERFDWEYIVDLLESLRKEKMRFERSWIIRVSKMSDSLLSFSNNLKELLSKEKMRELDRSIFTLLDAYMDKILPQLQIARFSNSLELHDSINIMDLEKFSDEIQSLVIRSVLEEVLKKHKNTIVVLPEAWRFLPQGMGNPCKLPAEAFIRQGATNGNYLFIDSQDVTGVEKTHLKQISIWILGYQTEINEIRRSLDQIPLPKKSKPTAEDIATLKLGQFYIATREFTKKVYVVPSWLDEKLAKEVALGKRDVETIKQPQHIAPYSVAPQKQNEIEEIKEQPVSNRINERMKDLRSDFIGNRNDFFEKFKQIENSLNDIYTKLYQLEQGKQETDTDEIVGLVLQKMPVGGGSQIDDKKIIEEVLARMPKVAGSVTYEVAPLEKIKKDFLGDAKDAILKDITSLDEKQKRMLKWIEQNAKNAKKTEIFLNCFGKSATGGGTYTELGKKVLEMKNLELIRMDTQQRIFPYLTEKIRKIIEQYGATDQEIQQIYDHIIVELL